MHLGLSFLRNDAWAWRQGTNKNPAKEEIYWTEEVLRSVPTETADRIK